MGTRGATMAADGMPHAVDLGGAAMTGLRSVEFYWASEQSELMLATAAMQPAARSAHLERAAQWATLARVAMEIRASADDCSVAVEWDDLASGPSPSTACTRLASTAKSLH